MSQTVFRVGPKTVTPVDADVPREIVVTTNRTGQDTTPPCPRCRGIVWTVVEAERKWSMRDDPPKVQRLRSEEHTSELQSHVNLVCRLLLEKKKKKQNTTPIDTIKQ